MIDAKRRKEILSRPRPEKTWEGEPLLGGWYTEEEIEAAVRAIRDSMDWQVGFGFIVQEITDFEEAFAAYCGTEFAVSVSTASVGLDMAMRCLDLEPGDEVICPAVNFKASHMAVLGQGGKLVFCEIDPRTLGEASHAPVGPPLDEVRAGLRDRLTDLRLRRRGIPSIRTLPQLDQWPDRHHE